MSMDCETGRRDLGIITEQYPFIRTGELRHSNEMQLNRILVML